MATSAPSSSSACAFTAELEKLMAGFDCSLGQCSALSIRRTQKSVELKVSWASPGAPAQHLKPETKKGKSPATFFFEGFLFYARPSKGGIQI